VNVATRIAGTAAPHDREDALVRSLLTGIAVFRWLAWAWAAALLVVNRVGAGPTRGPPRGGAGPGGGGGALFCSVKDDGAGFDPAATPEGAGLRRSVRGRVAEVGGRVEVDGRPGRGTEVRCWVPVER
jgi:hypothetical protein